MSELSRWERLKLWMCCTVAHMLPDGVKRAVLYTLAFRVEDKEKAHGTFSTPDRVWAITFQEMYNALED